jgi:hypothetical protein
MPATVRGCAAPSADYRNGRFALSPSASCAPPSGRYKSADMNHDPAPKFAPFFGAAWTGLSIAIGILLLVLFFFGPVLMEVGHVIWILIRWIFSPII